MRANTEIRFSSQRKTVVVNGALVRYLKPDERAIAKRMMAALANHNSDKPQSDNTASGTRVLNGGLAVSLQECLGAGASPAGAHVLLLDLDGQPVGQVMDEIRESMATGRDDTLPADVVAVIGGNLGLSDEDVKTVDEECDRARARMAEAKAGGILRVHRVSLCKNMLVCEMFTLFECRTLSWSLECCLNVAR
jgi:tRNA pseudouridine-54 N-methylase